MPDVIDVLAQQILVLVTDARSLLDAETDRLCRGGLVGVRAGVEVAELQGGQRVIALLVGHHDVVVVHRAAHAGVGELGLVGELGGEHVEVVAHLQLRSGDELHVAHAGDDHSHGQVFASTRLGGEDGRLDVKVSHGARVFHRLRLGELADVDGERGGDDRFLDLGEVRIAVEERVKRIDVRVGHCYHAVEADGGNGELARLLRVHHILAPGSGLVGHALVRAHAERLLPRQRHLLRQESLEVRHIARQLCEIDPRVDSVGEHHRFLLVDIGLVGRDCDKKVVGSDPAAGLHGHGIIALALP